MNVSLFSNVAGSSVRHSRMSPSNNLPHSFGACLAAQSANNLERTNTRSPQANQAADTFSFEKYINARVPTDNYIDGGYLLTDANCPPPLQCKHDYEDLRQTREYGELPVSPGSAVDNMAYLRARFSGDISDLQVCDAIEAMYSMGIMSRYEHSMVWGHHHGFIDLKTLRDHPVEQGPIEDWTDKFPADSADAPLFHFHTLEDILNWLAQIRKEPVPELEAHWLDMLGESPFGAEI